MLTHNHDHSGFTLVELLIGMVVIAILISVGAPNFRAWISNTQIRTATESISNGLQLARAEAVRRNTGVLFSLTGTANTNSTWSVGCLTVVGDINTDGLDDCPAVIQSFSSTEGTGNAVVNADALAVTFNSLGRASNAITINVSNPNGGSCLTDGGTMRCLRVVVVTGGQVRMCNPALPNTNPQGC